MSSRASRTLVSRPAVHHRFAFVVAALAVSALGACGGRTYLELGTGGAGASSESTTNATTGTEATTVAATGAGGSTTTGTATATATTNGSTTVTTGTTGTGATSTSTTVGATTSTGGATTTPVACNGAPCTAGDICCYNPNGPGDHCGTSGKCDPGYVELSCSSPAACPGAVCCVTTSPNGDTVQGAACKATCTGDNEIEVCTQGQTMCPQGTMCRQSQQLGTGYRLCE